MKPAQIARELRRVADRIDKSTNPSQTRVTNSIRGILSHVAGSQSMLDALGPLEEKDAKTSALLWYAMGSLSIDDWAPDTDFEAVALKMKELAASVGVTDISYPLEYAKKNFESYKAHYAPGAPNPL